MDQASSPPPADRPCPSSHLQSRRAGRRRGRPLTCWSSGGPSQCGERARSDRVARPATAATQQGGRGRLRDRWHPRAGGLRSVPGRAGVCCSPTRRTRSCRVLPAGREDLRVGEPQRRWIRVASVGRIPVAANGQRLGAGRLELAQVNGRFRLRRKLVVLAARPAAPLRMKSRISCWVQRQPGEDGIQLLQERPQRCQQRGGAV